MLSSATTAGRLALYAIPALAVATMGLVLLGPGKARPVVGARVRGSPVVGTSDLSLRIETVRRLHGIDDAAPGVALVVEASGASEPAPATTGPDGIAEVVLSGPVREAVDLVVRDAALGVELAKGRFAAAAPSATWAQLGVVKGHANGDLDVRVDVVRGTLAAPFEDDLRFAIERSREPVHDAEIQIVAQGAEVSPTSIRTDARGIATAKIKPLAHRVELELTAKAPGGRGTWTGTLPVHPGAIWLDPVRSTERLLYFVSPTPRERAYVSLIGERGRIGGGVVPLAPDEAGFHGGTLAIEPRDRRWLHVVVSGDPYEQGAGTVAWPVVPPEGSVAAPRLELLLDGVPLATSRDAMRAGRARRVGIAIVSLAALLEIFLLVLHARTSQLALEKHLEESSMPEQREAALAASRDRSRLRTLSLVALVTMAFAIVAALAFLIR